VAVRPPDEIGESLVLNDHLLGSRDGLFRCLHGCELRSACALTDLRADVKQGNDDAHACDDLCDLGDGF